MLHLAALRRDTETVTIVLRHATVDVNIPNNVSTCTFLDATNNASPLSSEAILFCTLPVERDLLNWSNSSALTESMSLLLTQPR